MRLILLGCPGAGKGTQAKFLSEKYHIPEISTGNMLRAAILNETDLGKKIKEVVESGILVPDTLITSLVEERLLQEDCTHGFLLDGYPRTINQAEALQDMATMDYVIDIDVPAEEVVKRLSGRRVHPASGRVYHILYQPPRQDEKDDETGEPLIQRADDAEEVVRKRLRVYEEQTIPLREFYKHTSIPQYLKINGIGTVEEIKARISYALDTQRIIL